MGLWGRGRGGKSGRRRGFKSRDVLVHSCESTSCGGGAKGDPEERACVGSRAAARSNERAPSLSVQLRLSLFFHLLDLLSVSLSFSPHHRRPRRRGFSFPFSVAPESSGKHATSFSLLLASARSLSLSPSFSPPRRQRRGTGSRSLVSSFAFLPSPFARRGGAVQAAVAGAIPLLSPIV